MSTTASIVVRGLAELERAMLEASEAVDRTLSEAADDAIAVLGPSIDAVTPEVSGDLKRANELLEGPTFEIIYSNFMPYARFVVDLRDFVNHGVESARFTVESIYDRAIDEAMRRLDDTEQS